MDSSYKFLKSWYQKSTCYYFNEIIKTKDFDFNNILIDKKSYENTLFYNISYKSLIDTNPLRIRFDKVNGFIRVCDGTRYLVWFCPEKHNTIFNRIRYIIRDKKW